MHDTVADSFVMRHWELAVVMHAWLTANAMADAWGRTLQAVHKLIVCLGMFSSVSPPLSGDCTGLCK